MSRKNPYGTEAVMTVFFALLAPVFLGMLFALAESARMSGARAHTAGLTELGCFSLFGEYEKKLLEDYEVFAVDGAYGSEEFSIDKVNDRLKKYLNKNAEVKTDDLSAFCFDPWQVRLSDCRITEYALLSDDGGEPFYQQAVFYMKQTAVTGIAGRLLEWYEEALEADEKKNAYEQDSAASEENMEDLAAQEKAKREDLEELDAEGNAPVPEEDPPDNPLQQINRLRKKSLLEIVCPGREISTASVAGKDLCSKRFFRPRGNLRIPSANGGLLDDLLFREYLLEKYPNWSEPAKDGDLQYQLEYILAGKTRDKDNLKAVVIRLLLLREGCNYAYAVSDGGMNAQARTLAAGIIGWTGMPALVEVLKHAILLGWCYAESMLDVRCLMSGGRVPIMKTPGTWQLSLEDLYRIADVLEGGTHGKQEGYGYTMYLRLLLNLQWVSEQKKRGLDLAELNIRKGSGLSSFRADHCIVAARAKTQWEIPQVLGRISSLFLPVHGGGTRISVRGGFAYDWK